MIYYGGNDYRDYLAHYGVVGMRWGIRRYQPYSYTRSRDYGKSGKEIGLAGKLGRGMKGAADMGVKAAKTAAKGVGKAVKYVKEKKEEKEKKYLINEASPRELLNKRNKLTDKEINDAINRIRTTNTLRDLESEQNRAAIVRGKQAINDISSLLSTVSTTINNVNSLRDQLDSKKKAEEKQNKIDNKASEAIKNKDFEKLKGMKGVSKEVMERGERAMKMDQGIREGKDWDYFEKLGLSTSELMELNKAVTAKEQAKGKFSSKKEETSDSTTKETSSSTETKSSSNTDSSPKYSKEDYSWYYDTSRYDMPYEGRKKKRK